jgi:hypothetical protein
MMKSHWIEGTSINILYKLRVECDVLKTKLYLVLGLLKTN